MHTVRQLYTCQATRLSWSLKTGLSEKQLFKKFDKVPRQTKIRNFVNKSHGQPYAIPYLGEDDLGEMPIAVLRYAAKAFSELEALAGNSIREIADAVKGRHYYTTLQDVFPGLNRSSTWFDVYIDEFRHCLNEFRWWADQLDDMGFDGLDAESAEAIYVYLGQEAIRGLPDLEALYDIAPAGWEEDKGILENITEDLSDNLPQFVAGWLEKQEWFMPVNAKTHRQYSGFLSFIWLNMIQQSRGYKENLWATRKQWRALGYEVKESELHIVAPVVHVFSSSVKPGLLLDSDEVESRFGMRVSFVYNAEQVTDDNGQPYARKSKVRVNGDLQEILRLNEVRMAYSDREGAYYSQFDDEIVMPSHYRFVGNSANKKFHQTLSHELIHWTGHHDRLDRDLSGEFGDEAYALEELIAELGAAFLCARFGLKKYVDKQNVAYIASWLQSQNSDAFGCLDLAARRSSHACNYLLKPLCERSRQ